MSQIVVRPPLAAVAPVALVAMPTWAAALLIVTLLLLIGGVIAALWLGWPEPNTSIRRYRAPDIACAILLSIIALPQAAWSARAISFDIAPSTPEEYDQQIRNQIEVFTKVAKAAGMIAK